MVPEPLSSLSVETIPALVAEFVAAREWLAAAAALAGIVTGLAFGALFAAWRLRRAIRTPLARLEALADGDDASPVPGVSRRDLAGEVARATERAVGHLAVTRGREASLRAALDEASARAAAAERRAREAEARADEARAQSAAAECRAQEAEAQAEAARQERTADSALIAAVAAVLAEELLADETSETRTMEEAI